MLNLRTRFCHYNIYYYAVMNHTYHSYTRYYYLKFTSRYQSHSLHHHRFTYVSACSAYSFAACSPCLSAPPSAACPLTLLRCHRHHPQRARLFWNTLYQ